MTTLTVLDEGRPTEVEFAVAAGSMRIPPAMVEAAVGWRLEDRGLCRGDVCIPVRDPDLATADGVSLPGLAAALGRPLALDVPEQAAYLGAAAADRAAALAGLEAPAFSLPDLGGRLHSLAEHRGTKVLLAAWASW